jgi:hypothetical protein
MSNGASTDALVSSIETLIQRISTQSLDISFNELLAMFEAKELDIAPEYQRLFRWSEGARSRFIESLILEMPVPPIYVVEETEGKWVLIDGLQRISSYLHLRGELTATHLDPPIEPGQKLKFVDCDLIEELNGKTFDELPTSLQIKLKRSFVRVEVVRKGSDKYFQYHMFKRLNTGGQLLSEQQVRNCTIRLLDTKFADFIIRLSDKEDFKECVPTLTQERVLSAYDQELVLRFFALKNARSKFKHDVSDFLTEYMEAVSRPENPEPFDYDAEERIFDNTFGILKSALGEMAFALAGKNGLTRGFSIYHYEAITMGIQPVVARASELSDQNRQQIRDTLLEIKLSPGFTAITRGGGKNSPGPLRDRIQYVQTRVEALP